LIINAFTKQCYCSQKRPWKVYLFINTAMANFSLRIAALKKMLNNYDEIF